MTSDQFQRLIESTLPSLHEEWLILDSPDELQDFRQEIINRFTFIPGIVRATRFVGTKADRIWLLWRDTTSGPRLVDYQEYGSDLVPSPPAAPSFSAWLTRLSPPSVLAAAAGLELYRQDAFEGVNNERRVSLASFDLRSIHFARNPRVDACLRSTHGILFWTEQLSDLLYLAGIPTSVQVRALKGQYFEWAARRQSPPGRREGSFDAELQAELETLTINGTPLLDLVAERAIFGTIFGTPLQSRPDFDAIDRLLSD